MLAERRRCSGEALANDIAEVLSLPKRDYTDARGAVVPPAGAPSPEDAIRAGRGDMPANAAPPTGNPEYPDAATGYCEDGDSLHLCGRDRRLVGFHDCGVGCHDALPAHEGEF